MANKTVEFVIRAGLCTGCGTCVALCPKEAITITIDKRKGTYIPKLDRDKCNNCGTCYKICPGHEVNFRELNFDIFGKDTDDALIGNHINLYSGHSTNSNIRYNSSSGGLVTQFLIFALEERIIDGALVIRMNKDNPLEPEPFIARTKEEIIKASKSKYCPVPANISLKEVLEAKNGEKFAVVGLPCHIQGIRKAEQINKYLKNNILLHIGLVCNHSPTFLATEFVLKKKKIDKADIKGLEYRGNGWPGEMNIYRKNKPDVHVPQFSSDYWGLIFSSFFFPFRCMLCYDKVCGLSDASFADAWTRKLMKNDNIGTSLVISRNETFEDVLNLAISKGKIELKKVDRSIVVQSQGLCSVKKKSSARIKIMKIIGRKVPEYHQNLQEASCVDYISALSLYIKNSLSSKRDLWYLVELYQNLVETRKYFKQKLF